MLKVPGEPEYPHSSGCVLTVEEAYPHLAAGMSIFQLYGVTMLTGTTEMLASLIIMRHIVAHNL